MTVPFVTANTIADALGETSTKAIEQIERAQSLVPDTVQAVLAELDGKELDTTRSRQLRDFLE